MDWRNNKLVAIAGIIITLVCLGFAIGIPIYRNIREKKRQAKIQQNPEYQQWFKQEQDALQRDNTALYINK